MSATAAEQLAMAIYLLKQVYDHGENSVLHEEIRKFLDEQLPQGESK